MEEMIEVSKGNLQKVFYEWYMGYAESVGEVDADKQAELFNRSVCDAAYFWRELNDR